MEADDIAVLDDAPFGNNRAKRAPPRLCGLYGIVHTCGACFRLVREIRASSAPNGPPLRPFHRCPAFSVVPAFGPHPTDGRCPFRA